MKTNQIASMNRCGGSSLKPPAITNSLNTSEIGYLRSLVDPFDDSQSRIPNIYPIPTSLFRVQNTINVTAGPSGFCVGYLAPWSLSATLQSNGLIASDVAQWGFDPTVGGADVGSTSRVINILDLLYQGAGAGFYASSDVNAVMSRFRVVSAGIKIVNTTAIGTRAGFITTGHSLERLNRVTSSLLRNLPTSSTTNCDEPHVATYVPHDPNCFDFYGYSAQLIALTFQWQMVSTVSVDQQNINQIPEDIEDNYVYWAISGAANNTFSIEYVINYEYVPGPAYVQTTNPIITDRGNSQKAIEALVTAPPSSSLWDNLKSAFAEVGTRALDFMGAYAAKAVAGLVAAL